MELGADHPYPLVDTHAHLIWDGVTDTSAVLARARQAGLVRVLCVATDQQSSHDAIDQARAHADVFASVGIHPNDLREGDDIQGLAPLAMQPGVVAIGETGLDYYRDRTPPERQREALHAHLELAARCGLPIIIHNRSADDDLLEALGQYRGRVRGVLHCFSGDRSLARRALDLDYYLSFAGNLTYPSAAALRAVAAGLPAERLLVETDSPFLAPVPHRGKRNEPAFVQHTLRALAECRTVAPAELAAQIMANAQALFGW